MISNGPSRPRQEESQEPASRSFRDQESRPYAPSPYIKDGNIRGKSRGRYPGEVRTFRSSIGRGGGGGGGAGGGTAGPGGVSTGYRPRPQFYSNSDRDLEVPRRYHRDSYTKRYFSESEDSKNTSDVDKTYLLEDPRISKLVRRLIVENDLDKALSICTKLMEAITLPENTRYIKKAYETVAEALFEAIRESTWPQVKIGAAAALGKLGSALYDYDRHLDWLNSKLSSKIDDQVKGFLISSFTTMFSHTIDDEAYDFSETLPLTMSRLQEIIESTDSAQVFTAGADTLISLAESYPEYFSDRFIDTVDILVGWHVDSTQPKNVKDFSITSLERLSYHWCADLAFSTKLMAQFLEDMTSIRDELEISIDNSTLPRDHIYRIASFIGVFNAVARSLGPSFDPLISSQVSYQFLQESCEKIISASLLGLKTLYDDELTIVSCGSAYLFIEALKSKISGSVSIIYELIALFSQNTEQMNDCATIAFLDLVRKTIKEISGNLPASFIVNIIGSNSALPRLKMTTNVEVKERVISVYHCLLNLKNIPLLQDVYKYVLEDLEAAYTMLIPNLEPFSRSASRETKYNEEESTFIILFMLQCLTDIANARNSIIGMWALQPSILELLAIKLQPQNTKISIEYPTVQFSILYLLYSHCKNNNHFIASSDLVTYGQQRSNVCEIFGISTLSLGETSMSSPTSAHFSIILNLFNKLFETKMSSETCELLLKWVGDIFIQLEKYNSSIYHAPIFKTIIINTIKIGFSFNTKIVTIVANNLETLFSNKTIMWNYSIMKMLCDLCFLHIDNNDNVIRQKFTNLITFIPWDIVILDVLKTRPLKDKYTNYVELSTFNILTIQKDHLHKGHNCGPMMPHHFKTFMGFLLFSLKNDKDWLNECFVTCFPLLTYNSNEYDIAFFKKCAKNLSSVLTMWATWEAAQLCTSMKLRTPLGKPQETFTSIESVIKKLANELTSPEKLTSDDNILTQLTRNRMLVEFFEFLEKSIFNAAEGCSSMTVPVTKIVKTFFHTNNMTCREWVTRVRPAALTVALHSGHAASVVRHSYSLLYSQVLKNTHKTIPSDVILQCITFAKALIKLKEAETLIGLYSWIKKTYDTNLKWIKACAEEASMRYDSAIFLYKLIINNSRDNKSDTDEATDVRSLEDVEKTFILQRITNCYTKIHCWSDLLLWKELEPDLLGIIENFQIPEWSCCSKFQEDDIIFVEELCDWNLLLEHGDSTSDVWSCNNILKKSESILKNIAIKMIYQSDCIEISQESLVDQINILQTLFQELNRNQPNELIGDVQILQIAAKELKRAIIDKKNISNPFFISPEKTSLKNVEPIILNNIFWWSDYFCKASLSEDYSSFMECMRLDLIKTNRKHGNYSLSRRELIHYFSNSKQFQHYSGLQITHLENLYEVLLSPNLDLEIWSLYNVIAVVEASKILYANNETKNIAIDLCANASLGVSQRLALGEHPYDLKEKGTRMLLTLAKWVQNNEETILTEDINSPLTKLVTALPEIGLVNNNVSANVIPILNSAVGKLLQFSVNQCPGLAKTWFNFGSWCFRWGRKMVEYSANTGGQLTDSDRLQIQSVMLHNSTEDFESVCDILSKIRAACDDEDIDWNEINTSEMIESQLRSIPSLRNIYPEHINLLVDIWRQAQKRVFSYYELSADAYFKFLELSSTNETINHNGECSIIIATLRLLRLIVKHAMELQNVLENGLSNTPTQPWKVIIPQLFSRLNHPENYVRKRVSELLCRLAEDAPHLITFPAVVGAVENEKINLTDMNFPKSSLFHLANTEFENDFTLSSHNEKDNDLNSCFMDMVETLSKQAPETILQVQLLVKELRRINLLWDELWLGTLAQQHSEITHRIHLLTEEISQVKTNFNLQPDEKEKLIKQKHTIIMKPLIYILEQLVEITTATPETPHEQNFQDKYLIPMQDMLDKLRNPSDPSNARETWAAIHQFQTLLHQKQKRTNSLNLKMSDISPTLANMTNSVISMPGVQTSHNIRITIKSIENTVSILPSKTKPKKLIFHGSNGKIYTYLFKGLEDLHLDERIMQFLSITNTMLAQDKEDNSNQTYSARHYSVIPLGPKSGLISWVDNLTPLFTLYKKWQEREKATSMMKTNNYKPFTVFRPSELYYNKLTPLLQAAGVSIENRKQWPASILKQVLSELLSETPNDLLAKELWCNSVTPGQWWQTIRRYSFSVAVMSIIGYVIGLGDRHLHNILVDLSTGEVVHIDYNVCFEKGKTLRVPEKVPFRMTANMENALGVTGIEGIFRLACEHVLKVAKRGRETLLTLLEAFVYDPLVEWGGGTGAGVSNTIGVPGSKSGALVQIERTCAIDMLAVKVTEVRHDWNENRDEMLIQLPVTTKHATTWVEHLKALTAAEARLQHHHRQIALIKELEALGSDISEHPLVASAERYTAYKEMKDALDESAKNLLHLFETCGSKIDNYSQALDTIKGPQLGQWMQELNFPIEHDDHLVFNLIREFLMNAGQSSMITQCEQSESELSQIARQQNVLIKACLELLSQYAAVIQYYPQSFMEKHKTVMFRKWSGILLETDSPDVCRDIMTQIQTYLTSENANSLPAQQGFPFAYAIQAAEMKLGKLCEKLQNEGGQEALARCEKNLAEAKAAIISFISQDNGADKAIECIAISTICALNRRYIMLETGAHSAGECLVDLTSREGEWFFDDMTIISAIISELVAFIPKRHLSSNLNDERIPQALEFVIAAKSIFSDLQDLSHNFQMIILPEAIKKIQCEDPSVLHMINDLNTVVLATPIPLNELLAQLEMHLRYIIMEMELPSGNVHLVVADLKARFEVLVNGPVTNGTLNNAGQMLIMGFNGLFIPLTSRGIALIDASDSLCVPHVWKKVDQINDAKDLAGPLHNEVLRSILEDIIFIKRILAINEFFALVVQTSCAFKGVGIGAVHDDERLCKPIKKFIADFVRRQLLGVHSQCVGIATCLLLQRFGINVTDEIEQRDIGVAWKVPLEELCEISVGNAMKNNLFTSSVLQQASALINNFDTSFKRRELIRILERNVHLQGSCVNRLKLQATAHNWLKGDAKPPVADLKRFANQLINIQPKLTLALEKHRALVASAEQRLKWAAGANPALNEVMAAFECAVNIREDRLNVERTLSIAVGNICAALASGALLDSRNQPNKDITNLASKRRLALALAARAPPPPVPLHESLLQMLRPEGTIDLLWVNNVSALLTDMISQLQKNIVEFKCNLTTAEENLKTSVTKLTNLKSAHENLISYAKTFLKFIIKISPENMFSKVEEFLAIEENYRAKLNKLTDGMNTENLTEDDVILWIELIKDLEQETPSLYAEFISFGGPWYGEENPIGKRRGTLVRQVAGIWSSPARQTPPKSKASQQQNAYATSVWKRVRLKLEGRDPDQSRKSGIQEQVDYIINEAMSLDNLCLLYEGWTPWV